MLSCPVVKCVRHSGWCVCVMWSELLMTSSAISCPVWSSVFECQIVKCVFISSAKTECGMFVMYCMQCCMSVSAVL